MSLAAAGSGSGWLRECGGQQSLGLDDSSHFNPKLGFSLRVSSHPYFFYDLVIIGLIWMMANNLGEKYDPTFVMCGGAHSS